jgi:hypothetical protein
MPSLKEVKSEKKVKYGSKTNLKKFLIFKYLNNKKK